MTVGERIKNVRIKRGLSQVELADKVGLSKQTLYKYENDIITNIPSDKIEAIADVLKTKPSILMGWQEHLEEFLEREKNDVQEYEKAKWLVGTNETIKNIVMSYSRADELTKKHVRMLLEIDE